MSTQTTRIHDFTPDNTNSNSSENTEKEDYRHIAYADRLHLESNLNRVLNAIDGKTRPGTPSSPRKISEKAIEMCNDDDAPPAPLTHNDGRLVIDWGLGHCLPGVIDSIDSIPETDIAADGVIVFIDSIWSLGDCPTDIAAGLDEFAEHERLSGLVIVGNNDAPAISIGPSHIDFLTHLQQAGMNFRRRAIEEFLDDFDESRPGRPPLGYEKEDGELKPGDDFGDVVAALSLVKEGKLSKRKAAKRLDSSHKSINRALEQRPGMYGLEES